MEGRFSRKQIGSRDLGFSSFRWAPHVRSTRGHTHREQEEAYVVVAGSGRVRLDGEIRDIRRWDVVRVAPEVVRAFEPEPRASRSSRSAVRSQKAATGWCQIALGRTKARTDPRRAQICRLLAGALAVLAPRPAAGSALALLQFLLGPPDAARPGALLLGIVDP